MQLLHMFIRVSCLSADEAILVDADDQGGLPMYVSAPGLVQQINQLQTELQTLRDEMHHSLLHDKHQCINDL